MKPLTKKAPTKTTDANSKIVLGLLKGRMKVAKDAFKEDNKKTLNF
jgi:hypothetical protein